MRILGIDPGTRTVGYGVIDFDDDGAVRAVEYGVVEAGAVKDYAERFVYIHKQLTDIMR